MTIHFCRTIPCPVCTSARVEGYTPVTFVSAETDNSVLTIKDLRQRNAQLEAELKEAALAYSTAAGDLIRENVRLRAVADAAEVLVEQWAEIDVHTVRHMDAGFAKRLDALAREVRGQRG